MDIQWDTYQMQMNWEAYKNGHGSIDYWYILKPISFITIYPITGDNGTMYKVEGPHLSRPVYYDTLKRAKEVAEDLCVFGEKHPPKTMAVDLRNMPHCGVKIWDGNGNEIYDATTTLWDDFHAPDF